ncbi:hypothetical protein [Sphingobium sp. CCH11-B1]|jgi:hypothetical protein|uniref:hypothetical protein n=1 Tax=Sphingobium sp. CCH11-B1 TaxID=1768781 RepID=UPI0012E35A4A|nr:hypothetical protein [Sphingobium sp. CCH11-B1]MEA3389569.1 hypothetical protein [Pseudomonadota bacterium]
MLNLSVIQDRSGYWVWEVFDDEDVYLRSDRAFAAEQQAWEDLRDATHLIKNHLPLN